MCVRSVLSVWVLSVCGCLVCVGASCVCVCVCVLVCLVCVCLVCVVRAQTLPSAGAGWLVVVVACSNWAKNSTLFSGIGKDNCFANICPNTPYTCVCKRNAGDQLTLLGEQRARSQVRSVGCVCVCALLTVCFALRSVWLRSVWFVCVVCVRCVCFVCAFRGLLCVCVCVCVSFVRVCSCVPAQLLARLGVGVGVACVLNALQCTP